jgi:hypothetical protein
VGSGNKERKQENTAATANYNAALQTAQAESPYDKRRREINESILDWSKGGDYRQPPSEAKVFFNFADVAARQKARDVLANSRGQGVSAMGAGANPTVVALDKQHRDAQLEEEAAREYQDTAARVVGGAAGELGDMAALDQAKRMGVLSTTAGMKQSAMHIPKQKSWWEKLWDINQQAGQAAAAAG